MLVDAQRCASNLYDPDAGNVHATHRGGNRLLEMAANGIPRWFAHYAKGVDRADAEAGDVVVAQMASPNAPCV
jgi:hypothetical protein